MSTAGSTRIASTRSALVAACRSVVATKGLKGLTMSRVADTSGLARATVYNHVRDRDELLQLLIDALRTEFVAMAMRSTDCKSGLNSLADWIAQDEAMSGLRTHNPATLVDLAQHLVSLPEGVALDAINILGAWGVHSDLVAADAAMRWLTSFFLAPGTAAERAAGAELVATVLKVDLVR